MGVRGLSLAQQCKHTDKREPLVLWNACLGAQVGIRFHPTQLQRCICGGEEAICFCSEREQNKHSDSYNRDRYGWAGETGILVWRDVRDWGGDWRDKVVCGQSQHREVTICLVVFVCLSGGGGVIKYHSNRSRAPLGYKWDSSSASPAKSSFITATFLRKMRVADRFVTCATFLKITGCENSSHM